MFTFFKKISFKSFVGLVKNIFRRFPLSAMFSILAFGVLSYIIRFKPELSQPTKEILMKVFTTIVISFFFSIAWYLYTESRIVKSAHKHYYQLITLIFTTLFYIFFDEGLFSNFEAETVVYIILTVIGVTAFLFISKYFKKYRLRIDSQREFYVWSYSLIIKLIMSAIIGIVAMVLGFIAISSIFTLFNIEFLDDNNWYGYWAVFSLVLFAPFFFLSNVPQVNQKPKSITEVSDNKFYSFLINFVGLSAIFIYFIILYAYTVKVLFNFSLWPQGEVTWMVILFSFFGYLIYFAAFAFRDAFKHAVVFRKILPYAVVLQTLMLFYAIGLRINQYDLTINRYLVVVFGLWLFCLSLYYIISKRKDLSVSFYSLLVVVILMSIGPWSVYLVPKQRQLALLEENLVKANILQENKIIPLVSARDIDAKLSGQIYGGIEYLCNYHGCEVLDSLFKKEIDKIKVDDFKDYKKRKQERLDRAKKEKEQELIKTIQDDNYNEISNSKLIRQLTLDIKVERWNSYNINPNNTQYLKFGNDSRYDKFNNFNSSIEVSSYDYYLPLSSFGFENNIKDSTIANQYYVTLDSNTAKLSVYMSETLLEEMDVRVSIIDKILNNKDNYIKPARIDSEFKALLSNKNMTFSLSGKKFDYRVNLYSIAIKNPQWTGKREKADNNRKSYSMLSIDGFVLLRLKQRDLNK